MKVLLLTLLALGAALSGRAQAALILAAAAPTAKPPVTPTDHSLQAFFSAPEVMLPRLYEAAIARSGEIARLDATRGVAEADVKLACKRLLNMLALTGAIPTVRCPTFATAESQVNPVYLANPFNLGAQA